MNDVYRAQGLTGSDQGGIARVRALRQELERSHEDVLLLHGGDLLFPSLMSRDFKGEQMVDALNYLDGDGEAFDSLMFVVFGNHEFDGKDPEDVHLVRSRVLESGFFWLRTNIDFPNPVFVDGEPVPGVSGPNSVPWYIQDVNGWRVGIFGLTLTVTGVPYATVRGDVAGRVEIARDVTQTLRDQGAELVVAVTHQPTRADSLILSTLGADGPDLIIGGHDHYSVHIEESGRHLLKADSDAQSATVVYVIPGQRGGPPAVRYERETLSGDSPIPDAALAEHVASWVTHHDRVFCHDRGEDPGCLDVAYARIDDSVLVGEELAIRGSGTNLGNWVTDIMREVVTDSGGDPDIAFINSGALRINQNLSRGTLLTRRHVEELIQFDDPLFVIELTPDLLTEMLRQSARCAGEGAWLQVSGLTFEYDTHDGTVASIHVDGRQLTEFTSIRAATTRFLARGDDPTDRDGYAMLRPAPIVWPARLEDRQPQLKQAVIATLEEARAIAGSADGSIAFPGELRMTQEDLRSAAGPVPICPQQ